MEQMNQAYKVFTRICLNNWHYIDRKVLGLNESINFFTCLLYTSPSPRDTR